MLVGIVDYEAGNLKSVETAFKYLGADFIISSDPDVLIKSDKLVFPGVGEASSAMEVLNKTGIGDCLKDFAKTGKTLLGICLGSQIVLDESTEGHCKCLGIIPGNVQKFNKNMGLKIPHMGWNQLKFKENHPIFDEIQAWRKKNKPILKRKHTFHNIIHQLHKIFTCF